MVLIKLNPTARMGANEDDTMAAYESAVLHRHLALPFLRLKSAEGSYYVLDNGRKIFDASGGAAVGCIGWGNERVAQVIYKQSLQVPYTPTIFYTTTPQEQLCRWLVDSTKGAMSRAYIINSGQSLDVIMYAGANDAQARKRWKPR